MNKLIASTALIALLTLGVSGVAQAQVMSTNTQSGPQSTESLNKAEADRVGAGAGETDGGMDHGWQGGDEGQPEGHMHHTHGGHCMKRDHHCHKYHHHHHDHQSDKSDAPVSTPAQ